MSEKVSIIIPTLCHNSGLLIGTLNSLFSSKIPANTGEVCVIVNATTPKKIRLLQSFKSQLSKKDSNKLTIKWVGLEKNLGFAGAVDLGINKTTFPLVVLLNDDTVVSPNWLQELLKTQQRTQAEMVASKILLASTRKIDSLGVSFWWRGRAPSITTTNIAAPNDVWWKHPDFFPKSTRSLKEPFGPDAAAALYTRDILLKIGGFRTIFFAYLEDVDVALRARKKGAICVTAKKAIVTHFKHKTSEREPIVKKWWDFKNWLLILTIYPKMALVKFMFIIILERAKNLSGLTKSIMRILKKNLKVF